MGGGGGVGGGGRGMEGVERINNIVKGIYTSDFQFPKIEVCEPCQNFCLIHWIYFFHFV